MILAVSFAGCRPDGPPDAAGPSPPTVEPSPVADSPAPSEKVTKLTVATDPAELDPARAILIAEQFVRDNGYADHLPTDAGKLVSESIEWEGREKWPARRHNTLLPRALGYLHRSGNDPRSWTIGFECVNTSDRAHGRAVTMDAKGGSIRMQHKDLVLKFLEPRPE